MKIAVVGAGIFGCTTAIKLANGGHDVHLFDPLGIMKAASSINQYRVHRGYHYPRSVETTQYVKRCVELFEGEYPNCMIKFGVDRYYAIAKNGTLTTAEEYEWFMLKNGLEFQKVATNETNCIDPMKIRTLYRIKEDSFDIGTLYLEVVERLRTNNVKFQRIKFTENQLHDFDLIINATYANINGLLPENQQVDYQFELCEKLIVRLPDRFLNKSMVILDGNFCCIDPFFKNFQVVGHVERAIHDRQIGKFYQLDGKYRNVLNLGVVKRFRHSKNSQIIEGLRDFFPMTDDEIEKSKFGSMLTIRTVLPNREHDDSRPSYITKHSDKLYSIFSGKIATCVDVANQIVDLIK